MATTDKRTSVTPAKKASRVAAPAKRPAAVLAKAPVKAKPAAKSPAKAPTKTVSKTAAPVKATAAKTAAAMKPIKTAFTKTALNTHLAEQAGVDAKTIKAVLAALEATMLASVHKKGLGAFTLPGLLKISAHHVPAKKKRLGKDPFSGELRTFAAKPASTKIKMRSLKKLKDAAL